MCETGTRARQMREEYVETCLLHMLLLHGTALGRLFWSLVIFCHINVGKRGYVDRERTFHIETLGLFWGWWHWDMKTAVCVCVCACVVCACARAREGLPVERSMWTPTHSAASRLSSFRINPQSLNINRTGVLKPCSANRGNGIMHRPKTPQMTMPACHDDVVIMSFPPTCTHEPL